MESDEVQQRSIARMNVRKNARKVDSCWCAGAAALADRSSAPRRCKHLPRT
jgi:hypothetical protein